MLLNAAKVFLPLCFIYNDLCLFKKNNNMSILWLCGKIYPVTLVHEEFIFIAGHPLAESLHIHLCLLLMPRAFKAMNNRTTSVNMKLWASLQLREIVSPCFSLWRSDGFQYNSIRLVKSGFNTEICQSKYLSWVTLDFHILQIRLLLSMK